MSTLSSGVDLNESRATSIIVAIVIFPVLALLSLLLRIYTRLFLLGKFFLDDWLAIAATAATLGMCICMAIEVQYGLGRHVAALTISDVTTCFKALYFSVVFYMLGLAFIKLSILCQYLRFCVVSCERRTCWALLIFMLAYSTESVLTAIFVCWPIDTFWTGRLDGGCVDRYAMYYANSLLGILSDVAVLVFPAMLLRHLTLPLTQRVVVGVIVAFGGVACIASIIRFEIQKRAFKTPDRTWDLSGTVIASAAELGFGIICTCVATLRPLASRCFPRAFLVRRSTCMRMPENFAIDVPCSTESKTEAASRVKLVVGGKMGSAISSSTSSKHPGSLARGHTANDRVALERPKSEGH